MNDPWRIRDPVLGYIELNETEVDLINTSIFQRLRGIKQLALANLVYPGAHHNRFEHAIGVCHIAKLMAKNLKFSEDDERLVRLAALLHDLGHGPFSHISEDILKMHIEEKNGIETNKIHEKITQDLILNNLEIRNIISEVDAKKIVKLLNKGRGEPVTRAVVSGPLDADKQDYLLRDSYYCGVQYGVYDHQHLIQEMDKIKDPMSKSLELGITPDGIRALEQFLLAKYYITTQVYQHKIRLITDQMLVRAVKLGIQKDGIEELRELYIYKNNSEFLDNYIKYDDAKFFNQFYNAQFSDSKCCRILESICRRKLLKQVFKKSIEKLNIDADAKEILGSISKHKYSKDREELEQQLFRLIVDKLPENVTIVSDLADPDFLIVNSYEIKHVRSRTTDNVGLVLIKHEVPLPFEHESKVFDAINNAMDEKFIEIYAPVEYSTKKDRRDMFYALEKPIIDLLKSYCESKGVDQDEN